MTIKYQTSLRNHTLNKKAYKKGIRGSFHAKQSLPRVGTKHTLQDFEELIILIYIAENTCFMH